MTQEYDVRREILRLFNSLPADQRMEFWKRMGRFPVKPGVSAAAHLGELSARAMVAIESIHPSPENDELYGAIDTQDQELIELAIDIAGPDGVRDPITISFDGFIISGHRRFAAAKIAGLTEIPVRRSTVRRADHTAIEWKRLLAAYNKQRVKSAAMRVRESLLNIDPELAHRNLQTARMAKERTAPAAIQLRGMVQRSPISAAKFPMLRAAVTVIDRLKIYWPLTVRQVHYRLLNSPPLRHASKPDSIYRNDRRSYQDLCDLLTRARLTGEVEWESIDDATRPISGLSYYLDAGQFVNQESYWFLAGYRRDLMQSQSQHIEIVAEKMTVQSILKPVADRFCIPLTIGRGYCSIRPRYELAQRFQQSGKDGLTLLMCSDLDPDGDCIAESFARSMRDDFDIDLTCVKAVLSMNQVQEWQLPPNGMAAKPTSSSYADYRRRYGTDSVFELEAIEPAQLQAALTEVIEGIIDVDVYQREVAQERQDAATLQAVKESVADFLSDLEIDEF